MSNLIKSSYYTSAEEKRLIEIVEIARASLAEEGLQEENTVEPEPVTAEELETQASRDQILKDAAEMAERQMEQARKQADKLLSDARSEIEAWWAQRRQEDETASAEAAEQGYQQGLESGRADAEELVRQEYAAALDEAKAILELAQQQKDAMIEEAEPFLIELSTSIAAKLLNKQLSMEPDWILDLVKSILSRRREQGTITLCVSPGQFAYLSDAKEELMTALDSQAELLIVPDATVDDHGCVVRSAFGSMDARVDTQLTEIRQALLRMARRSEETTAHE